MGEDRLHRHIERVLGRDDTPEDWQALHAEAEAAPTTWQRLLRDLEDDAALRAAVHSRLPEQDVDLPVLAGPMLRKGRGWVGWMVAACAVFLWLVEAPGPFGPGQAGIDGETVADGGHAGSGPPGVPVQLGGFEGDLPDMVLASEPAGDGQFDVVVLRRAIERRRVPLAPTLHRDDSGQTFAMPVSHSPAVSTRSY